MGLGVDAYFRSRGVHISHTTIATASYTGMGQQGQVTVKNLEHLARVICPEDGLLIIDDVYESGNTIKRIVEVLRERARANAPRDIRVATVHHKPGAMKYDELPIISVHELDAEIWIDYPHELADMVSADDPDDALIKAKSETIWQLLRAGPTAPTKLERSGGYFAPTATELLHDCIRLGVNIAHDDWRPDFLIALWPGGVVAGLPVHEVYKYTQKKRGSTRPAPDHISLNTLSTRVSYQDEIVGVHYLEERINRDDNILIIDTTFRAGRLVNNVITHLKELLRRNLDHERIRVASVYYNPNDETTWTARPDIRRPHYYLREVDCEVIYPTSVHKLGDPRLLHETNPALYEILWGALSKPQGG